MARLVSMGGMSSELKRMRSELRKQTGQTMRQLAAETSATAKGLFGHYQTGEFAWPTLSSYTLNQAKRQQQLAAAGRSGDSPLLVTGELRDSVEYKSGLDWAAAGTDSEVMLMQELGGPNPMQGAADIPPRPVFEPTAHIMYDKLPSIIKKNFDVIFGAGDSSTSVKSGIKVISVEAEDDGGEF